jgi:hypothetical protein
MTITETNVNLGLGWGQAEKSGRDINFYHNCFIDDKT